MLTGQIFSVDDLIFALNVIVEQLFDSFAYVHAGLVGTYVVAYDYVVGQKDVYAVRRLIGLFS